MKTTFAFLILFVSSYAIAQNNEAINKLNSKKQKTGKWVTYEEYEGDSLKTICNYKNGIIDGQVNTYFPDDKLYSSITYINGVKQGKAKSYYKNGCISDIFMFNKGTTVLHIKFDPQGKIFQESDGKGVLQYVDGKQQ